MSRRKWCFNIKGIVPIIVASIGLGMLLSIIIPFWIWIAGVGVGLIIYAWYSYCNR